MDNMDKWWIIRRGKQNSCSRVYFQNSWFYETQVWTIKLTILRSRSWWKFGVRKLLFSLRIKVLYYWAFPKTLAITICQMIKGHNVFFSHFTFDCYWHSLATDGGPVLADKFSGSPCNSVILSDSSSHSPVSSGPGTLWCRHILSPYAPT